ncbi:MAG: endolytic transglycosylase MltG [Alphaproteobacteria bacterium]|nr:MAG: endolytic transglycosylase MltG [Alphaproteobacteria bacterium]
MIKKLSFIYLCYLCIFYLQPYPNLTLDIPKRTSLWNIDRILYKNNLTPHRGTFAAYAIATGQRRKIKHGEYKFCTRFIPHITHKLVNEDVVLYKITFPEGSTVSEIIDALNKDLILSGEKLRHSETLKGLWLSQKTEMDDHSASTPRHDVSIPEGSLFPSTYVYPKNTSRQDILKKMQAKMKQKLQDYQHPKLTQKEFLILASLVEKETHLDHERPLVASIFLKRFLKGMPLQADPSIIYGLNLKKLTRGDFNKKTPYNTYMYKGMPPTPICCPGEKSLQAVKEAVETTPYLYFVLGKDGHIFSKTFEEHKRHVRNYKNR